MANKVTGDGHVLKESSHTAEDKIKDNNRVYINKTQSDYMNAFRESIEMRNMKNLKNIYLWKATSKSTSPFKKYTIKAIKVVRYILKYRSKLPNLYTPSNAQFIGNY